MAWSGFTVLPGVQDPFGSDVIAGHYQRHDCDIMITLCDVFMMNPDAMRGLNVVHWLPVDSERMGAQDAAKARGAVAVIAMSRHGERAMRTAGFDPFYIPHGIDTQVFSPPPDRAALRAELGVDAGAFLVAANVANKAGPRKAIQEQVIAFARFHQRHPEARLLLHTFAEPAEGTNVRRLAEYLGIADKVMLPDQYAYATGMMDTPILARWYGIADVLLGATYGEGFGLPVLEAQACGTPVIVTDCSALAELCGAGWKVQGEPHWAGGHDSMWTRPSIANIDAALENAWRLKDAGSAGVPAGGRDLITMDALRAQARQFALQYDADALLEQAWKPALDAIDASRPRLRRAAKDDRAGWPDPEPAGDGKRDLLLLVPTRGRPGNVQRLINAVEGTSAMRTDVVFGVDDDDPDADAVSDIVREAPQVTHRYRVIRGPRQNLAGWTNILAGAYAGQYAALASFGDDHEPRTDAWDEELLKALTVNGPGFAYPNDLVRDDIPEAVVVSSEIAQALGWVCQPDLTHFFVDNVWADLGRYAQCITYLPDVIVEHHHPARDPGAAHDDTYRAAEAKITRDQQVFEAWRRDGFARDVATVRQVRARWLARREGDDNGDTAAVNEAAGRAEGTPDAVRAAGGPASR
jgi:glycosyltransferase involved in cell wall biosynthesis